MRMASCVTSTGLLVRYHGISLSLHILNERRFSSACDLCVLCAQVTTKMW